MEFNINITYFIYFFFLFLVVNKFFLRIKGFLYSIFIIYIIISGVIYKGHFLNNKMGFGPDFDDSFYYQQSLDFLFNRYYNFDTIFEIVISPFVYFSDSVFNVIGINWVISVINLGLLYRIFKLININFEFKYLFFLAFNYFYMESSIFLYRDQLGIFFFLSSILFYMKNNKKISFMAFVLCFLVRPATALFLPIYIFLKRRIYKIDKPKLILLLTSLFIIVWAYNYLPVGFLTRSGLSGEFSNYSLAELSIKRYSNSAAVDHNDITAKLLSLGFIAFPLVFIINIFSPIRIRAFFSNVEFYQWIDYHYVMSFTENILSSKEVLTLIHIFIISFCMVPFFFGLRNIYKKSDMFYILIFFIFVLFFVSYVSYQPRHKLHFLIFMPLIISYCRMKVEQIIIVGIPIFVFFLFSYMIWLF